jgi:hypothetical protein
LLDVVTTYSRMKCIIPSKNTGATIPIGPKLAGPLEVGLTDQFGSRGGNPHSVGGSTGDHSSESRSNEAGHWAEGEASELWTPIWGSGETMGHRGGAPR